MAKTKSVEHDPGDLIKQANPITTARYDLSPLGVKAFLLAYSKLTPQDKAFPKFSFSIAEVAKLFGNDAGDARALKQSLRRTQKESIEIEIDGVWSTLIPLPTISISEKNGTVTFTLNEDLQPFFLDLKAKYTMFPVEHAFRFGGRYSLRLYQLVMLWQGKERKDHTWDVELEVETIRKSWGIADGEYKLMSGFRRMVIERAVLEINSAQVGVVLTMLPPRKNRKNITHFVIQARRIDPKEPRLVNPKPATQTEDEDEKMIRKFPKEFEEFKVLAMKQPGLFGPKTEFEAHGEAVVSLREWAKTHKTPAKRVGKATPKGEDSGTGT